MFFFRKRKSGPDPAKISSDIAFRSGKVVHLTHNDFDAVGADAVHRIHFRTDGVQTHFSSVGKFQMYLEAISQVPGKGDLLSISDLAFRRGLEHHLRRAKQNGWRIEWRDHHRWTEDEIGIVRSTVDLLHLDTGRCACAICAMDLGNDDVIIEEIASVVCDYDLWRHRDPRSKILGIVLQRHENRDHVRDMMMLGVFDDGIIRKQYEEITREMQAVMEKTKRSATLFKLSYRTVVSPMFGYPSETAAYLRKELKSDIEVLISESGKFSIRSAPPISHLIAREFRGGGHPHAAGGFIQFTFWDKVRLKLFKKNHWFYIIAEVADSIR